MSHRSVSRTCIAVLTTALFLNSVAVPTSFAQESAAAPAANEATTTATPTPSAPTSSTTAPAEQPTSAPTPSATQTEQPTSAPTSTAQPTTTEKQDPEQKDPSKKDPEKPTKPANGSSPAGRVILTLINFLTGGSLRPLLALFDDHFKLDQQDEEEEDVSKLTKVQLATRWISVFVGIFTTLASLITFGALAEKTLRQV